MLNHVLPSVNGHLRSTLRAVVVHLGDIISVIPGWDGL